MMAASVDQVRASGVADLAASVLDLSDAQLLGLDAGSAEALVAAAQRVINAVTAVQVVTLAALRAGDLEPHGAQQVVDEVPAGDLGVCAAVEAVLFPKIVDKPNARVGLLARKAVVAADPGAAARLVVAAQVGRFVSAGPSGLPGLMRLEAELDAGKGRLM